MKNLLRFAAITAASVALVAGNATAATAAPGDSASVTLQPGVLGGSKTSTSSAVLATVATNRPINLRATVNVNGAPVASNVPIYGGGFYYQQVWGAGVVSLTNFTDSSGQPVAGASNAVNVRYGVKIGDGFSVRKVGKKLTFKFKARYINNSGASVGIRKAKLQVKKGSKWKTLKNVKLKKNGTAKYKKSDKKKRNYRLVIKETATYQGVTIKGDRKI